MDSLTLGILCNFKQMGHLEIRLCSRGRSHKEGLVHHFGMLGKLISIRVHSDCFDAKSMGRSGHTTSDFSSICDEQLFKHLSLLFHFCFDTTFSCFGKL